MKKNTSTIAGMIILITIIWGGLWRYLLRSEMVLGATTDISASEIVALTNLERTKAGKEPLKPNSMLEEAALAKAADMVERGYFEHLNPEGRGSWELIEKTGYSYEHAGENLARNFENSQAVVEGWMNSDSHRENLLKENYTDIGVAVVETKKGVYVVQLLATPFLLAGQENSGKSGQNFISSTPLIAYHLSGASTIAMGVMSFSITLGSLTVLIQLIKMLRVTALKKPNSEHWRRI
jgi:hypothetical protein